MNAISFVVSTLIFFAIGAPLETAIDLIVIAFLVVVCGVPLLMLHALFTIPLEMLRRK